MTVDVVTVFHREENRKLAQQLTKRLAKIEPEANVIQVDNRTCNRGWAGGCNHGAADGNAPFIVFINPDTVISGEFFPTLLLPFDDDRVVIAGERFGKPVSETLSWGCDSWVCGALMCVRRNWFPGFDENYCFGWEETDLIRQAQVAGRGVIELSLPQAKHQSPEPASDPDRDVKATWFDEGRRYFDRKWRVQNARRRVTYAR
jgi:GT2 family glycosyltransferase